MSKKFEISGNNLVITDTVSSKIEYDDSALEVSFNNQQLRDNAKIFIEIHDGANSVRTSPFNCLLSEAVNSALTPFDEASFRTFARTNFKSAAGGSAALNNRIEVTQANMATTIGGTIDSTKEYFITGNINLGTIQITVPATGINLNGFNFDLSSLFSTEDNYTMFVSDVGGSGDILGMDYALSVSGANSKVYDLIDVDGTHAFEFSRINFNGCTSLGVIKDYRQGLESGTGRFGGKPELTLDGTWIGGYFIETSIVRGLADGAYSLFKAGATFTMASRFRSNQNIDLPASASFFDFAPGNFINPSTLQLEGCLISRSGIFDPTDSNITPNISASNLVCKWSDNNGVQNTFAGGQNEITAEASTTIVSSGTFVDLAGTYTPKDLQHFDEPSNGQLRHLGTSPIEYEVSGQLVLGSTADDEVDLKIVIWRDATTSFEDGKITRRVIDRLQGIRNVAYFVLIDFVTLNINDYVKLQVSNVNATNDITAEVDSFLVIKER